MKLPERNDRRFAVIQSATTWLTQPMTWLYVETKFLPESVESHILCNLTQHLDQFSMPHIHSLSDESMLMQWLGSRSWYFQSWRRAKTFDAIVRDYAPEVMHSHFGD